MIPGKGALADPTAADDDESLGAGRASDDLEGVMWVFDSAHADSFPA